MSVMVLYEDQHAPAPRDRSKGSDYPLHKLILSLAFDTMTATPEQAQQPWQLHARLDAEVRANPRKGIDQLLMDLGMVEQLCPSGLLLVLVDRDKLRQHLNKNRGSRAALPSDATDALLTDALRERSDAPARVTAFLLYQNIEGVLLHLKQCDATLLPDALRRAIERKSMIDRDLIFREAIVARQRALRDCLRGHQPGVDALARAIAAALSS